MVRFKRLMGKAWKEYYLDNKTSAAAGGYHGANTVEMESPQTEAQIIDALALQVHQDRENMSAAIDTLVCQARADRAEQLAIKDLLQKIMDTLHNLNRNPRSPNQLGSGGSSGGGSGGRAQGCNDGTYKYHCWSHGYTNTPNHTSRNCNNKKEGHVHHASCTNCHGGSRANLDKCVTHLNE